MLALDTSVTTDSEWLAATPTSGEAPLAIEVTVDRSGLADGSQVVAEVTTDAAQDYAYTTPEATASQT